MEYRHLGRSGLQVSTISLGTMTFGGKGIFSNLGGTELAGSTAFDHGVNLFDTANMYSDGLSEEILGQAQAPTPSIW